jgi:hypothetical protein
MNYLILITLLTLFSCDEIYQQDIQGDSEGCENVLYTNWNYSNYVLPYPVGKSYRVNLGNCSSSYHSAGQPDQFAYDFDMSIGTKITASRAGKVVAVVEGGEDYTRYNNYVTVDHGDKTFAIYMHLTKDGAAVKKGDNVKRGDIIGYSGATGLAGYPHLHLVVTKDKYSWPYVSVPITFRNTSANPRGLKSYTYYKAKEYSYTL